MYERVVSCVRVALQVAKLKTELESYEQEALVQESKKDSSLQVGLRTACSGPSGMRLSDPVPLLQPGWGGEGRQLGRLACRSGLSDAWGTCRREGVGARRAWQVWANGGAGPSAYARRWPASGSSSMPRSA